MAARSLLWREPVLKTCIAIWKHTLTTMDDVWDARDEDNLSQIVNAVRRCLSDVWPVATTTELLRRCPELFCTLRSSLQAILNFENAARTHLFRLCQASIASRVVIALTYTSEVHGQMLHPVRPDLARVQRAEEAGRGRRADAGIKSNSRTNCVQSTLVLGALSRLNTSVWSGATSYTTTTSRITRSCASTPASTRFWACTGYCALTRACGAWPYECTCC